MDVVHHCVLIYFVWFEGHPDLASHKRTETVHALPQDSRLKIQDSLFCTIYIINTVNIIIKRRKKREQNFTYCMKSRRSA